MSDIYQVEAKTVKYLAKKIQEYVSALMSNKADKGESYTKEESDVLLEDGLRSRYNLGLGIEIPAGADLNDYKTPGVYRIVGGGAHNLPKNGSSGVLVVSKGGDDGVIHQRFFMNYTETSDQYVKGWEWIRVYYAGVYDEWYEWHCIGGIDSIVAEGETNGWTWRKWANGNAECHRKIRNSNYSWTTWGSLKYATGLASVSYPFEFVTEPDVHVSSMDSSCFASVNYGTKTACGNVYFYTSTVETKNSSLWGSIHVIGRWK